MNYLEELAKRNMANVNVLPLINNKATSDEDMAINVVKATHTSTEVEERTAQVVVPSIGIQVPDPFKARTYDENFDTKNTALRIWSIHDYLLKGAVNLLVAEGGAGKSSLTLVEAISIATNRNLLGLGAISQGNVLVINNEDDDNEFDRRIGAICIYYGINTSELKNKLFVRSGYEKPVKVANELDRSVIESSDIKSLIEFIVDNEIDVVIFDPYISTHDSNENDNSAIDKVVQQFKHIAAKTYVAIRLVHHTRKNGNSHTNSAGDIEIARGASALKDGARVCHTLVSMTKKEAEEYGIDKDTQQRLIRIDGAKMNFSLNKGTPNWFYKESVHINNGESVGVIRPYHIGQKVKLTKTSVGDKNKTVLHDIGYAILSMTGIDGGVLKGTELKPIYTLRISRSDSTANNHFELLPVGSNKSERLHLNGKYYRIFQTMEDKAGAPRFIHLKPDE